MSLNSLMEPDNFVKIDLNAYKYAFLKQNCDFVTNNFYGWVSLSKGIYQILDYKPRFGTYTLSCKYFSCTLLDLRTFVNVTCGIPHGYHNFFDLYK